MTRTVPSTPVADVVVEIDIETLSVGDIEDLENAESMGAMINWLVQHAGCERDTLRSLPFRDVRSVMQRVNESLKSALEPGK
jgi:hypothetical protein